MVATAKSAHLDMLKATFIPELSSEAIAS